MRCSAGSSRRAFGRGPAAGQLRGTQASQALGRPPPAESPPCIRLLGTQPATQPSVSQPTHLLSCRYLRAEAISCRGAGAGGSSSGGAAQRPVQAGAGRRRRPLGPFFTPRRCTCPAPNTSASQPPPSQHTTRHAPARWPARRAGLRARRACAPRAASRGRWHHPACRGWQTEGGGGAREWQGERRGTRYGCVPCKQCLPARHASDDTVPPALAQAAALLPAGCRASSTTRGPRPAPPPHLLDQPCLLVHLAGVLCRGRCLLLLPVRHEARVVALAAVAAGLRAGTAGGGGTARSVGRAAARAVPSSGRARGAGPTAEGR